MFGLDRRDVAADDDRGTGRQTREQPPHALTEIAVALLHARELLARRLEADAATSRSGSMASSVRQRLSCASRSAVCDRQCAIEADRRDIADLAPEPPLDAAGDAGSWP